MHSWTSWQSCTVYNENVRSSKSNVSEKSGDTYSCLVCHCLFVCSQLVVGHLSHRLVRWNKARRWTMVSIDGGRSTHYWSANLAQQCHQESGKAHKNANLTQISTREDPGTEEDRKKINETICEGITEKEKTKKTWSNGLSTSCQNATTTVPKHHQEWKVGGGRNLLPLKRRGETLRDSLPPLKRKEDNPDKAIENPPNAAE